MDLEIVPAHTTLGNTIVICSHHSKY